MAGKETGVAKLGETMAPPNALVLDRCCFANDTYEWIQGGLHFKVNVEVLLSCDILVLLQVVILSLSKVQAKINQS